MRCPYAKGGQERSVLGEEKKRKNPVRPARSAGKVVISRSARENVRIAGRREEGDQSQAREGGGKNTIWVEKIYQKVEPPS